MVLFHCSTTHYMGNYPCNTPESYAEINACRLNLDSIIPGNWVTEEPIRYCPKDGGMYIKSSDKFKFEYKGTKRYDYFKIYLQFIPRFSDDHISNKINTYDSICFLMKEIYSTTFPNHALPNSPFTKFVEDSAHVDAISKYNKLSSQLWLNENEFPKHYTKNYNVIIYTIPDLMFITDTAKQYVQFRSVYNIVDNAFTKYKFNCYWKLN